MSHLLSLHSPTRLLEVNSSTNLLNHLMICENNDQATRLMQKFLALNKQCGVRGQVNENIVKIQINDLGLLNSIDSEIEKARMLKSLLLAIDKLAENENKRVSPIDEGFYYYNLTKKQISFYQLTNQINQESCLYMKNINNINGIQIFGIFAQLLCYSSNPKQYFTKWRQLAFKRQGFHLTCPKDTKIDQFISSVLNKQLPTLKIALHSIEMTIQKILWVTNHGETLSGNKKNYQDLKISLPYKKQSPRRLKQSNSMTNLSSSSKNRKYKKVSPHIKNEKLFKQNYTKTSTSFWNGKMADTFVKTGNSTLLGTNKKNTSTHWHRESAMLESFSKINQFNLQKSVINQSQLIELLQRRQKIKNVSQAGKNNQINQAQQTNCQADLNRIQIKFTQKPKKQLKLSIGTVDFCFIPQKRSQCKINSTLYSINQRPCLILSDQKNFTQPRIKSEKKEVSLSKIKPEIQQPKKADPYVTNALFLYESVQQLCNQKPLRRFWLISLYAMYLFYFSNIFQKEPMRQQEAENNHKTNLVSMATRIDQYKSNPEFSKNLDQKNIDDIQSLLSQVKNLEKIEPNQNQQTCLRVLKKQFQKNKLEIIKQKGEFIKNNRFKIFLIYMMRLAICISVVTSLKETNYGVQDFSRYSSIIRDQSRQDNEIDLLSELKNYEQLF